MESKYNTKDIIKNHITISNDEKELEDISKDNIYNIDTGPFVNKDTYEKDKKKIKKYCYPFYQFFKSSTYQKLPMFTHYPDPRGVKHIVVDYTHTITANQPYYVYVMPFNKYYYHGRDASITERLYDPKVVACFLSYKVVVAKILVKQVGIMSINDGYGTVMDAVIVPGSSPIPSLINNLLSVQVAPSKKLMLIDGRDGIQANFIGSPLYEDIYPNANLHKPSMLSSNRINDQTAEESNNFTTYIPANSVITVVNSTGPTTSMRYETIGAVDMDQAWRPIPDNIVWMKQADVLVDVPEGSALFVRISPPSINISIKVYIEMVVEGPLKSEFWTDMPQYLPDCVYPFDRLSFALSNCVPSLQKMSRVSNFYAATDLTKVCSPPGCSERELNFLRCLPLDKKKYKSQSCKKKVIKEGSKPKKFLVNSHNIDSVIDLMKASSATSGYFKHQNTYMDIKEFGMGSDQYYYAMENAEGTKLKNLYKIKGSANTSTIPEVPKLIGEASLFVGYPTTTLWSAPLTNRIFSDADTPLPVASYQYFPVIDTERNQAFPVLIAVKVGKDDSAKKSVSYKVLDSGGIERKITFHFREEDWGNVKEFIGSLETIVNYAYARNFHYSETPHITIRVFADKKIVQTSYMMALLAALYGAPSGGYMTGSFKLNENSEIEINEMDQKIQDVKLDSATTQFPLLILAKNVGNGAFTNIISGVVPEYADGRGMMANNLDSALLYVCLPLRTRLIKTTPFNNFVQSDKYYLCKKLATPFRWYICYSNITSTPKLEAMHDKNEIFFSDFRRASPDFYCVNIVKSKRFVNAMQFYSDHPELLNSKHIWHFYFDGNLYVEKNIFSGDISATGTQYIKPYTPEEAEKTKQAMAKIRDITKEDVDAAFKKAIEGGTFGNVKNKTNVADIIQSTNYPEKSIALKRLRQATKGFSNLLSKLSLDLKKNIGTKIVSLDNRLIEGLNMVGLNVWVKDPASMQKNLLFKYISDMVSSLGSASVPIAGKGDDWDLKTQINPQSKAIIDVEQYIRKNPIPEVKLDEELAEESERNKKESRRPKSSGRKRKEIKEADDEDQKEEEVISTKKKNKKRNKLDKIKEEESESDDLDFDESSFQIGFDDGFNN